MTSSDKIGLGILTFIFGLTLAIVQSSFWHHLRMEGYLNITQSMTLSGAGGIISAIPTVCVIILLAKR